MEHRSSKQHQNQTNDPEDSDIQLTDDAKSRTVETNREINHSTFLYTLAAHPLHTKPRPRYLADPGTSDSVKAIIDTIGNSIAMSTEVWLSADNVEKYSLRGPRWSSEVGTGQRSSGMRVERGASGREFGIGCVVSLCVGATCTGTIGA